MDEIPVLVGKSGRLTDSGRVLVNWLETGTVNGTLPKQAGTLHYLVNRALGQNPVAFLVENPGLAGQCWQLYESSILAELETLLRQMQMEIATLAESLNAPEMKQAIQPRIDDTVSELQPFRAILEGRR